VIASRIQAGRLPYGVRAGSAWSSASGAGWRCRVDDQLLTAGDDLFERVRVPVAGVGEHDSDLVLAADGGERVLRTTRLSGSVVFAFASAGTLPVGGNGLRLRRCLSSGSSGPASST
jgi:hypothetical protein